MAMCWTSSVPTTFVRTCFWSVYTCWKQTSAQTVKSDRHNFLLPAQKCPLVLPKVVLEAGLHFRGFSSLPKAPGCFFRRLIVFIYLFFSSSLTQKYWRGRWWNFPEKGTWLFPFLSRSAESAPNCPFMQAKEITQSHKFPWPRKSAPLLYIFKSFNEFPTYCRPFFPKENRTGRHTTDLFPQNYSAEAQVKKKVQKGPGYFWQPYSNMGECVYLGGDGWAIVCLSQADGVGAPCWVVDGWAGRLSHRPFVPHLLPVVAAPESHRHLVLPWHTDRLLMTKKDR